jgi:4-diphosphocytidyl-2-C-methyl-D-erythritol kinase
MASITLRAFAKINLSLRISNSRHDGYHDVQTVLQAISLFDRVTCERRRGPFQLRCDMAGVPTDRTNLVWKGAQLLWTAAGREGEPRDAMVTLQKKIPMKAGLGGGSSDAAATMLGLRKLWRLRVPDQEVQTLAAKIGSDVPFFLVGGTALGLGRGDEVYPLESLPRHWVVLAIPPFGIATKDAYRWFDEGPKETRQTSPGPFFRYGPAGNDLEPAVIARHPLIDQLKQRLTARKATMAAMSGSGSTVFGVFTSRKGAAGAARALEADGVRVLMARFLGRSRA